MTEIATFSSTAAPGVLVTGTLVTGSVKTSTVDIYCIYSDFYKQGWVVNGPLQPSAYLGACLCAVSQTLCVSLR